MKRCTKCVLPETYETIIYDTKGACNICSQIDFKNSQIDWDVKKNELNELVNKYKGKYDYDCLVPFSGGKDSVWTLYYIVKVLKLKPLVVRFDHGFLRPNVEENTKKVQRELGVDFHHFSPNWKVQQKLMLQSFLDKGDFCWHCHTGIFSYPMWVAIRYKVPLIFWGEPSAEYTSYYSYNEPEEVDEKRFNRYINLGINSTDMYIRLNGKVEKRDLLPYTYPPLNELKKINYRSVCLGSYIPWDIKKQVAIIKKELGWKGDQVENVPGEYDYEKIECYMQGVRDYIKYIKRGYTRPSQLASIDIRNNRLERDKAMELIADFEGKRPPSLDLFLEFTGLTEEEFYEISISHIISPQEFNADKIILGNKTHDFDKWSKDGKMNREETELFLKAWRKK